jgi:hypothetical protein
VFSHGAQAGENRVAKAILCSVQEWPAGRKSPAAFAFALDHRKSIRERVIYQCLFEAAKLIPRSKLPTTGLPFVTAFVVNPV